MGQGEPCLSASCASSLCYACLLPPPLTLMLCLLATMAKWAATVVDALREPPASCLYPALRRVLARTVTFTPSRWRGSVEERRGAGAALGTIAEASGMASAAPRRPRWEVAQGCPTAGGTPGGPSRQWPAPRRGPDDRRYPRTLLLPAGMLSSSRRREEWVVVRRRIIAPIPQATSSASWGG